MGAAAMVGGCGFTPVYGPQGAGQDLLGALALEEAGDHTSYLFNRRVEERLGRGQNARFKLSTQIETEQTGMGTTSTGSTTRYRVDGTVTFSVIELSNGKVLQSGQTSAFSGYSTTGSTTATLAAERDAQARLMVMLADQVIDQLLIQGVVGGS